MLSFHLSSMSTIGRRAIGAATVATMMTVAGCSDETTAPRSNAAVPDGANAVTVAPRSLVTFRVKTIWGDLIPETPGVRFVVGTDTTKMYDNDALDKDPTIGIITVSLPVAMSYTACVRVDTPNYGIDIKVPTCNTVAGNTFKVDAGSIIMRKFPVVAFYSQNLNGYSIVGGRIRLWSDTGYDRVALDNGQADMSAPNDGKVVFRTGRPSKPYNWCEEKAPTDHYLTNPSCGTMDLSWDTSHGVILKHKKIILVSHPF